MNLTKRDVLELRRRLTKNGCSFTRMAGCYVSGNKNIITKFAQPFLDLEDDAFYKYLEIAKKVLSGTPGGNLLELSMATSERSTESRQLMMALKESKLKNDGMLDRFYEQVMEHYHYAGNYLILLFHDVYDVPSRAEDHAKLDESEEVYEYLLCALCPVELSKPGLGYHEDGNCFGPLVRDWVVGLPEIGFVYPAFSGRSTDLNSVMYFVKPGKDSQHDLMRNVLGCVVQRTASEEKNVFQNLVTEAFGTEKEQAETAFVQIQKNLNELVATRDEDGLPPIELTAEAVQDVMTDVSMPQEAKEQIVRDYQSAFADALPCAQNLIDNKLVQAGLQREATLALTNKIESLEQQLAQKNAVEQPDTSDLPWDETSPAIVVQVSADKAEHIEAQVIDGRRCLVIPIDEGDSARINGVAAPL